MRVNAFLLAHHITYFIMFIVPVARQSVWGSKVRAAMLIGTPPINRILSAETETV